MMKRFLVLFILALLPCLALRAQEYRVDNGSAQVDSSLVGRSVLSVLGSGVSVNQSRSMRSALDNYVANNASTRSISNAYPGIGVYRTFESPNFKVCVGDFRTKDEALKIYHSLKATYPTAIILKETINYPR